MRGGTGRPLTAEDGERVLRGSSRRFPRLSRAAFVLSTLLAVVAALKCVATMFVPDILRGPAVMNGSARAVVVWFGVVLYLAHNAFMLLFATPLNRLFLGEVAMMGLSTAAGIALAATIDVDELAGRCDPRLLARSPAAFIAVIVVGNGPVWLKGALPDILHDAPHEALAGTGLTMTCTPEIGPPQCRVARPTKESDHAREALPPRGEHRQAA
jgi:hypothetical protein